MVDVIMLGFGLALAFLIISAVLAARYHIWKEVTVSGARAIVQILILSSVIILMFNLPVYWSALILLAMATIAGYTTYARAGKPELVFPTAVASIAITSIMMLVPFFLIGIFPLEPRYLIPTGSILIGNAMNVSSLAIDRYRGELRNRRGEVEAYLALGTSPRMATEHCLKQGILSALIPSIDNMKNLGLVWIPGVMTGMLLSGSNPVQAAAIQVSIFIAIFLTGMISSNILLYYATSSFFTRALQLREDVL
ncbi:ABC transporter permease [Methanocella arvoryzae]|uniref:Predicted ABC-type transport system, permease component n=1 Tax=Methanocella arvoryzae (strain DSM 22066 / NBRC 105507 / MRE50) TaxID=351160 RepID=Q0W2Y1_METAR|nr:ABC transporter permease [Methanocella arvoryzae]CAJ37262.1 predicted ABC-type transport system, permease component [Methanocella arvoryzae MRE50]